MGKMQVFKKVRDDEEMAFIADQFLGVMDKADVSKHGNRAVFLIYNGNQTDCTNLDALRLRYALRKKLPAVCHMSHVAVYPQRPLPLCTTLNEYISKYRYGNSIPISMPLIGAGEM